MKNLNDLIDKGKVPHALLISGEGSETMARDFATKLLGQPGTPPDLHLYHPEGKSGMHAIDAFRRLTTQVTLTPHSAPYKVFLIYDAHRMLPTSSNALLKTFEEPPPRTVIILLTSYPDQLLPTILSRCRHIALPSRPPERDLEMWNALKEEVTLSVLDKISSRLEESKKAWEKEMRSGLSPDLSAADREIFDKEVEGAITLRFHQEADVVFDTILQWYRDRLLASLNLPHLFHEEAPGQPLPLEKVEAAIKQARLGLQRSLKLKTCLEVLFLRLGVL